MVIGCYLSKPRLLVSCWLGTLRDFSAAFNIPRAKPTKLVHSSPLSFSPPPVDELAQLSYPIKEPLIDTLYKRVLAKASHGGF